MDNILWVERQSPAEEFDRILFSGRLERSRSGRDRCEVVVFVHRDAERGDVIHHPVATLGFWTSTMPFETASLETKADEWIERQATHWKDIVHEVADELGLYETAEH